MRPFDVLVVGGGPAGLACALNAAAEGLSTALLEADYQVGGRCRPSHAIENYLGFLSITGEELSRQGHAQLLKFGVKIFHGRARRLGLQSEQDDHVAWRSGVHVQTTTGSFIGRTCVLALGLDANDPIDTIPGAALINVFTSVHGIPEVANGRTIVIVGHENSAAQAALACADAGAKVILLMPWTEFRMAAYLHPMLRQHPNIDIVAGKLSSIEGTVGVEEVVLDGGARYPADAVLVFNGASPLTHTAWLPSYVQRDSRGFIMTDDHYRVTSAPGFGLYAIGDIRAGSVKRVGAAAGEGTTVVQWIRKDILS